MPASTQKSRRSYFDYNATAPLAPGVAEAVARALELTGNPSSLHREGRASRALIDASREAVAHVLRVEASDIVFTSGGTEANHLGLVGLARCASPEEVVMAPPTLHPSLWAAAQSTGRELRKLSVNARGVLELEAIRREIGAEKPAIVAISLANHELGSLEDVAAVSDVCRDAGCFLFCDAVQGIGRIPVDTLASLVDGISLSAHKIGGPKGVGALWLRSGFPVEALIGGGKQESGRRPGTQAVALIAGFAAACERLPERLADARRQGELRDRLASGLSQLGAVLHSNSDGLCNTVHGRFPGLRGELLVTSLDLAGFAVSTGAACSSGTSEPSSVLLGIGLSRDEALEAVRLSIGPATQPEEVQSLLEVLPAIIERAQRFR